jgi:hypothetical protein
MTVECLLLKADTPAQVIRCDIPPIDFYIRQPAKTARRCLSAIEHERCAKAAPYEHRDGAMVGFAALTATLRWR